MSLPTPLTLRRALDRRALRAREALAVTLRPTAERSLPLRSPEGHALPCSLHVPSGPPPWPGVLLLPGGLDGLEALTGLGALVSARRLARAGFATLVFSPSGRGAAPGPNDMNGPLHQAECAEALALLLGLPEVDGAAVFSLSFGLAMGAGALAAHPALAKKVNVFMDWEGPPSRRWFRGVGPFPGEAEEGFWAPREAARALSRGLACPYHRLQSAFDHVHGRDTALGLEAVRAAAAGGGRVWLNGQEGPPFEGVAPLPPWELAQARAAIAWLGGVG